MPSARVVIYPAPVQGEGAAGKIAQAVATAGARSECDVLIVCRGGGSIEDLWAYNDEALARAIAACPIPVVSGVGHETDFTIADFVADVRAPTPTGAAQLVTADRVEVCEQLRQCQLQLARLVKRQLENRMQRLDYLSRCLVHPGERIAHQLEQLQHLANRLCNGWRRFFEGAVWKIRGVAHELVQKRPGIDVMERERIELGRRLREATRLRVDAASARLAAMEAHLAHLNPQGVLERGYSIVARASGEIVRDAGQVSGGDELQVTFARGTAQVAVKKTS